MRGYTRDSSESCATAFGDNVVSLSVSCLAVEACDGDAIDGARRGVPLGEEIDSTRMGVPLGEAIDGARMGVPLGEAIESPELRGLRSSSEYNASLSFSTHTSWTYSCAFMRIC